jgi:hypothetical protein
MCNDSLFKAFAGPSLAERVARMKSRIKSPHRDAVNTPKCR